MTILFAYDGSESANAAIAAAGGLLGRRGDDAIVLAVWEPLAVEALSAAQFGGPLAVPLDTTEMDERSERQSQALAEHGAALAVEHGFEARPRWLADTSGIADSIVATADELDVELIVLGARGLTGVRAFLGSVSNHVLQHASRPVLVIPLRSDAQLESGDSGETVTTA